MKQVTEEKKITKPSYVTVESTTKFFVSFRHYIKLKKSKIFILSL